MCVFRVVVARWLLPALLIVILSFPPGSSRSLIVPRSAFAQAILEQALWESNMLTYGSMHCYLGTLGHTYYDMQRVYYQIADYTKDPSWNTCADFAETAYRDGYVLPNNGSVPGHWNFSTGVRMDYQRTGDDPSKTAAVLLSQKAAFASDTTPLTYTISAYYSREVAYTILSYINAEALGEPKRQRRIDLVNQAYDHMDQWFVRFTWPGPWQQNPMVCDDSGHCSDRLSPFMVGLTAHTLIRDWEQTKDTRLITALRRAADWMWTNAWIPSAESMWYEFPDQSKPCCVASGPAPDLNLLIAPIYAFLYWQTGETKYRDQGDAIFAGGVRQAWLGDGKHFDQNYWWSFDYVKWRTLGTADASPPTVAMTAPAAGSSLSGSTVTVSATAIDNVGVAKVQFLLDGTSLGVADTEAPYDVIWDTTKTSNGGHVLEAKAYDAAGNVGSSGPVSVTVANTDTAAPSVSILSPTSGQTVSGSVTISLAASDNVGVTRTEYLLDDQAIAAFSPPAYTYALDTAKTPDGQHTLTVRAYDASGNGGTASISVTVANVTASLSDTTAPVLSLVAAVNISDSSATITWTTDEPSDSQVEYGPTTAYGSLTPVNTTMVTAHSQALSGLAASTLYHYRVKSKDAAGNVAVSPDLTFTTAAPALSLAPIGHWALDDGSGTIAADASGNGHTGTLLPNSPTWTTGRVGSALTFDGIDDAVEVPHAAALNPYPLTVAAWIRTTATSGVRGLVNKYAASSFNGWSLFLNNGNLCAWYLRDGSNYVYPGGGCPFNVSGYNDGLWHHVVYVIDAAGGRLYVDGLLKGSLTWTGTPGAPSTTQPLHLGRYGTGYLPGSLDDVRIYNRTLSSDEIKALYNVGLAALWPLDDGTGSIAADASGNGHTGTLLPNSPTWTTGRVGSALTFDGIDDAVEVPHAAALNPYPLTVAAWFKTTATSGIRGLVNKYVASSFNGWSLFLNNGNLCAWYLRDGSNYVYPGGGCPFNVSGYNDGLWHHVVYVIDAAGGRLYVDGLLKGSLTWTGTPGAPSTTQPLHLGRYGTGYFSGSLDDVRIYNRTLSSDEIKALYNSGLAALWPLDDGTGSIAADASGNGHTGTLLPNSPTWITGRVGSALTFDGIDDAVEVPHAAALNPYPLTVAAWIRTTSTSGVHGLVNKYVAGSFNGWSLFLNNGNLCAWYLRDGSNYVYPGGGCPFNLPGYNDGLWHHVVYVIDAAGGRLYVDGLLKGSLTWTGTPGAPSTTQPLHLGRYGTGYLPGSLDDVRIYNRTLSAEEIQQIFTANPPADTSPPTVSLTAPAGGSSVSGSAVTVSATAIDDVGIAKVQFTLDGINLGQAVTTAPYTIIWDTQTVSNGAHVLEAKAYDAAGNTGSSGQVSVTVANTDTTAPVVSLVAPAPGQTVLGAVTVTAAASDNVGVTRLEYALDDQILAVFSPPVYTYVWDSTQATNAPHTLSVRAYDAAGNMGTASVSVTVANPTPDTTPPIVSSVTAVNIADVSATIAWATDEASDTQVEFGPTTAYGSITPLNATLVTAHAQMLSSLAPGTLYHYRVMSKDASGNLAVSADFTFTTAVSATSSGIVALWSLDEGTGTVAADTSGNGYTGTLLNGPTWTTGRVGPALTFDGIDDAVEVPHAAALNPYPLTVAAWIRTTSTSGVRGLVNKYAAGSFNGWSLFLNNGNLCAWYLRDGSNYVYPGGGCPFNVSGYNDGLWHHVVYVIDAAGGRLYVDGLLKGGLTWTGTPGAPSTTQPLHLGRYPGAFGGAEYLPGSLDDVRIFNRALSAEEIQQLYTAHPAADTSSPTVSLTAPADGASVSGSVTVSASATDDVGVAKVQFTLDGVNLGPAVTTAPYTIIWDTTGGSGGSHVLAAKAYDAVGNVGTSAPVTVNVEVSASSSPIPLLSQWESRMKTYGERNCARISDPAVPLSEKWNTSSGGHIYYDAERVFYQIGDYLGNMAYWQTCAQVAESIYLTEYVLPRDGAVHGHFNFTTGLRMDYQRIGDPVARDAAILMSKNGAFCKDGTPLSYTQSADASRETAYCILSYINAEILGEPRRQRRTDLVNQAYDHMDQWFVRFAWPGPWQQSPTETGRLAPFMVGLTAHSLIRDWEATHDSRLIPALRRAADWMRANAWIASAESFWYDSNDRTAAAPDLNLLVAPIYAFLYRQTGEIKYRDQGDAIFVGGVKYAYIDSGKQFNQSYWWSFDYVKWRSGAAGATPAPSGPAQLEAYRSIGAGSVAAFDVPGFRRSTRSRGLLTA